MNPKISMPSGNAIRHQDLDTEEIDLHEYLFIIVRRRKILILTLLSVLILTVLYTFCTKPVYEASATLHVRDDRMKKDMLGGLSIAVSNPIDAELEILKSRTNAERVVRHLHLDWRVTKKTDRLEFKIHDFFSSAPKPEYKIELKSQDTFTVRDNEGNLVGEGKSGQLLEQPGFRLLIKDLKGKKEGSFHLTLEPFDISVRTLQEKVKAVELGKRTSLIHTSYMNSDPVLARDVVNALIQAYIEQSVSLKTEEANRTVEFVEEQLKQLRRNLDDSEINLQKYKSATGIMTMDKEADVLIQKIKEKELERKKLEVDKQALLLYHTKEYPAVKSIEKRQEAIQQQLASYEMKMRDLPEGERDLAGLIRLSKVNAELYTYILQKQEEARVARASTITNISIIDPAITPFKPVKPRKAQNLMLGLIFGLVLGLGLIFLLEYLDENIKNVNKAKRVMGLPILAFIPHIIGRKQKEGGDERDKNVLIKGDESKSVAAETFRLLRTNLHFTAINKEKKIMLFTSTFPQEGKSTIAVNEAITISKMGIRVLIIDGDLRRSFLHKQFGSSKAPGLSEILTGDATFEMALHDTGIPNLDLIPAGTTPPDPSDLLGSESMRNFLQARKENYDLIIIDAPSVLGVTDTPILATIADTVILVMELGRVPVKAAQQMREILAMLQVPIAGIVINDKSGKGESYDHYGKDYEYGYEYYTCEDQQSHKKFSK